MAIMLIHYSEIGIKGGNKSYFENMLAKNISEKTGINARKDYARILLDYEEKDFLKISGILQKIPGVANFSAARVSSLELEDIENESINELKGKDFETFKVDSKRQNKRFLLNSQGLNEKIGELIIDKLGKKAKMKSPDISLFIEVCDKSAYIYSEKIQGIGGLPTGVSGKVVSLLSGGIDSPVASYSMMKRGCSVILVHAFSHTPQSGDVLSKIEKIAKALSGYQLKTKLYLVPFKEIQKEIIANVNSKVRMIIYRRFMLRIANVIAYREKAKAIITGDSVGQVASQTLDNLASVYDASKLPIFAPLIGSNKEEIITVAKNIGTYEYSIMDYLDCCSFMVSNHPETKSKKEEIILAESAIEKADELARQAVKDAKILIY
jgi:thiamine biosynthesis protein ThiI